MAVAPVTIPVRLGSASYDILVGEGLIQQLPGLVAGACPAAAYAIVTDETVAHLYGNELARRTGWGLVSFPAGERHKTRETWAALTDRLLEQELGRDGAIVALGGGVVGDVAGFVAASYLRGIPFVQVPTTLLAMIDSSIGGKTGVDTSHGKNLVGAFHQPRVVIADLATLATLPDRHLRGGVTEAIKHGAIADADYFERLRQTRDPILAREPEVLIDLVARSVRIKAAVVADDERERGRRAVLNFGHTVGHAVEATTGYEMLHGEAVAVGLAVEAEIGVRMSVSDPATLDAISQMLRAFGLPVAPPASATPDRIVAAMRHDKKKREREIRMVLLRRLGETARDRHGEWTLPVDERLVSVVLTKG